jgi:pimeloyl-ACP methyl ester carboxylesterase
MRDTGLRNDPDAVPGGVPPRIGYHRVNGTSLYAEVRGAGPAVLIIPGGAEDAEGWQPVAERLSGHTVVTYDRRGTFRSGRDAWPGRGSAQHADDAAALLGGLGVDHVVVFGGSSGGIVALQLALRHPALVRRALVYEPGYLRVVPDGAALQAHVAASAEERLSRHPGDWTGAYGAFERAASGVLASVPARSPGPAGAAPGDEPAGDGAHSDAEPPDGRQWYRQREVRNAEAMLRDDIPILTAEIPHDEALASTGVDVRFSYGADSGALFRDISSHLAALRGDVPEVIDGVGHAIYLHPDVAADYIRRRSVP